MGLGFGGGPDLAAGPGAPTLDARFDPGLVDIDGFESTCELTSSIQGSSATVSCDEEGLNTESTDVSVVFGGGLDFAAGPGKFTVDARYDHGLTDIFAEDEGDADDLDETNKNIALSAGYLISLP